jgi:hypothetical protein
MMLILSDNFSHSTNSNMHGRAAHVTTCSRSLFASSISDRDLNRIPPLNPRHFGGPYHQATFTSLIQVVYFIVTKERVVAGLAAARGRRRVGGRPPAIPSRQETACEFQQPFRIASQSYFSGEQRPSQVLFFRQKSQPRLCIRDNV